MMGRGREREGEEKREGEKGTEKEEQGEVVYMYVV